MRFAIHAIRARSKNRNDRLAQTTFHIQRGKLGHLEDSYLKDVGKRVLFLDNTE